MTMTRARSLLLGLTLAIAPVALVGCAGDQASNEEENSRLPSAETSEEPITEAVKVGVTVKTTTLTALRNGPSADTKALRVVAKGAKIVLFRPDPENGYYRVKQDGLFGWIFGGHLDVSSAVSADSSTTQSKDEGDEQGPVSDG